MTRSNLTHIATRFHTPYGVCIHPGNWVRFSRPQGQDLLHQAQRFGLPTWSFDQWLSFWEVRSTWTTEEVTWTGSELTCRFNGETSHPDLRIALPVEYGAVHLTSVEVNGQGVAWETVTRYREETALLLIESGQTAITVRAQYAAQSSTTS